MEKHILILTTTSDFLWKFERENVNILKQMGYVVHFAANMNEPPYRSEKEKLGEMGIRLHHIAIARSPFLFQENQKALRQICAIIRKYAIQVVHCHTPVGGVLGRLAGHLVKGPKPLVIYTAHGFHFYKGAPLFNWLTYFEVEKALARYTDILIVINEEDYRNAKEFRLRKKGAVYKIPGVGLDTGVFHPLPEEARRAGRERLGIREDEFFLVSVGELNANKNHKAVLEALVRLRETRRDISHIRYGICGDGFFRSRLERWILEMGLKNTVTLYGYCLHVADILGCADAAVFPSIREGLGMAGLEALAMGIPVIASDNRGTREYMEHGRNGLVYRHDDISGFAQGIEILSHMDPDSKKAMRRYCLDSVRPFEMRYANAVMRRIYADVDKRIGRMYHEQTRERQHHYGRV